MVRNGLDRKMKRVLRVLVRVVTLPFVLAGSIGLYFVSLGFVFQEWLFEMPIGSIPVQNINITLI